MFFRKYKKVAEVLIDALTEEIGRRWDQDNEWLLDCHKAMLEED